LIEIADFSVTIERLVVSTPLPPLLTWILLAGSSPRSIELLVLIFETLKRKSTELD